jgi:hypothetical protein
MLLHSHIFSLSLALSLPLSQQCTFVPLDRGKINFPPAYEHKQKNIIVEGPGLGYPP